MATTVTYKGETLTTVRNDTKTLKTGGTWVEGDIGITDESGTAVVAVEDVPDSHGGIEKRITAVDISDTDATASDVAQGKVFYSNTGTRTVGTATIGGYSMDEIIAHEYSGDIETSATNLYGGAFQDSAITSFTAPNVKAIQNYKYYIFKDCKSLVSVSMAQLETVSNYCAQLWENCTALKSVSMPSLKTFAMYSDAEFRGCTALTDVYMPVLNDIGANEFRNCTSLVSVVFPKCTAMWESAFEGCSKLEAFDFLGSPSGNGIRRYNFRNCSALKTVVIRTTAGVGVLGNIDNFVGTPFASDGTGGTLYVPSALISNYQSASNWSTILGYANNQILPIEGSYYETHYADGSEVTA